MVVHACNPNTWEKDCEFKASLGYKVSLRQDPISNKQPN
jgi:hypothetical protein